MRVLDLAFITTGTTPSIPQPERLHQYEWYELVWFHDHVPTNLPFSTGSTGDSPVSVDDPPTGGLTGPGALGFGSGEGSQP